MTITITDTNTEVQQGNKDAVSDLAFMVERILSRFPATAGEIATQFDRLGQRGDKSTQGNPLASYVGAMIRNHHHGLRVSTDGVEVSYSNYRATITLPDPVREFLEGFTKGEYEFLFTTNRNY